MAKNVTLMGASYPDVPAVNLPQTGGGTATFTDVTGTTATAADVAQGKVFYAADGTETTGTASGGGGGVDMPVFTITFDDNWESVLSVTCNKTFAECRALSNAGNVAAIFISTDQSYTGEYPSSANLTQSGGPSNPLVYTSYEANGAVEDVRYDPDGTLTYIYPSSMSEVLNVTANGTYYPNGKTISEVNVNVPSSTPTIESLSVTQNGTYTAPSGTAYSPVTVNVSGGGGGDSAWTKVAETSYQVSTTSTSTTTVATWATGHSEIWTTEKIVHVRIRDTAGKRAGYFFGSDNYFYIPPGPSRSTTQGARLNIRYTSNGDYGVVGTSTSTGYGVFADTVYNDGRIRIQQRYNAGSSLIIDGTYKVEVYLLDPVGGVSIFE